MNVLSKKKNWAFYVERFESESIKGFGSHQDKCLSSSVIVVSEVKTAVNSNDA